MRFYGMTPDQVNATPITMFWAMNSYVDRLRAEEDQRAWRVAAHAQGGGEQVQEYLDGLSKSVGTVFKVDQVAIAKPDEGAFDQLRGLAALPTTK